MVEEAMEDANVPLLNNSQPIQYMFSAMAPLTQNQP